MNVLIFHGYLLRGTGSNVYNAHLAPALAHLGHHVHLLCQDRDTRFARDGPGSVTVHNPDIDGLLPVYVRDRYEGFEVKTFGEMSDPELERYIELNVRAVREVVASAGTPDAALANHLVMGPVILARAGLRFAVKVHGSDLSYTVLPDLDRFRPYAEEATRAAAGILVGSAHIAERLRQAVDDPAVAARVRLGPPGVDTDLFAPLNPAEAAARLERLADDIGGRRGGRRARDPANVRSGIARTVRSTDAERSQGAEPDDPTSGPWRRDPAQAASAIRHLAAASGPRVVFVGKLIVSKGVDLLLAAWPLVHLANPGARLLVVGFGELAPALRRFWAALAAGEEEFPRELATRGRGLEGGEQAPLPMLSAFLERQPASYPAAARAAGGSVSFAGRLEHGEVGRLLPACDALVFPSTFPEAFGMVPAEAGAAGVLPVSAAHSGALEVSRALADALPVEARGLVSFPLDDRAVTAIAERLNAWLALDPAVRDQARSALRETVARLWSWEGVARGVLAASTGRLDELPAVPGL